MNKKEIIKKWKKSGLLDNLTKMDKDSPMLKVIESIKEQRINEFPNIEPMNKVNEAGYNESTKFGPSENNPPYISDDFQIGPDGAYEAVEYSIPIYENGVKTEWSVDGIVGDEKYLKLLELGNGKDLPDIINTTIKK
jgi:hypothetical protein